MILQYVVEITEFEGKTMSEYLFVHFTTDESGEQEKIYFAVSRDGLNWEDLGGNKPVIETKLGTKGIRDPFIVYDEKLKKYFIIATDLNTRTMSWSDAVTVGSRSLFVWESQDLVHWGNERLIEVGIPGAGCVWAPEAVYCKEKDAWFVFWASMVKEEGDKEPKHRIYAAFTKDFSSFSDTFKFMEADTNVIDTDIVWEDGWYYRFSKDETSKAIILERSRTLIPEGDAGYERVSSALLAELKGVEGPEAYYLKAQKKWCLIVDQYATGGGYTPLLTESLASGEFTKLSAGEYDMGARKKRHGGIIEISDEDARRLREVF